MNFSQSVSRTGNGAWIFISHSHRDLEKVREIRNELERRRHSPLLFFLKCLEADDARLPELIRDGTRRLAHDRNNVLKFRP